MRNESIIAIVAIVGIVALVALAFVTILAIFCYKQENIHLFGKHKNITDINGKVESETNWDYDSRQNSKKSPTEKAGKSLEAQKNENDRKVSEAHLSDSNL